MWRVLVAEDDFKCRQQIIAAIDEHAEYVSVRTGAEALRACRESHHAHQPFDFILLDVTMPEMDGFEVLKQIRADEETAATAPTARIIMITAYKDSLMENYNMGWDDFITKPIDKKNLISHMRSLARTSVDNA